MAFRERTITTQLEIAHTLIASFPFAAKAAMSMLDALPTDVDPELNAAVRHAQHMVSLVSDKNSSRIVVARFTVARVVTLLEKHLAGARDDGVRAAVDDARSTVGRAESHLGEIPNLDARRDSIGR